MWTGRDLPRSPLLLWLRWLHLAAYNQIIARVPSFSLRHCVLRCLYGMSIGHGTNIEMGVKVFSPERIVIGSNSVVHFGCLLDGRCGLRIGNCVDIGINVHIYTLQHDIDDPGYGTEGGQVEIGDYAVISGRSTILPGVCVGRGAVVALGAVVTKNVPDYAVVAGVPARHVRWRNPDLNYRINYRRLFH